MKLWLYLRSSLSWFFALLATTFLGLLSIIFSLLDRSGKGSVWCMRTWARSIIRFAGVRLEIDGLENVPTDANVIFAVNHQAALDILVLAAAIPVRFAWVAKKELFSVPFLGWHMRRSGYIPIARGRRESGHHALGIAEEKVHGGASVLFFPEGTRSKDGSIQRFKRGAFELSLRTAVGLLPVTIVGSGKVLAKKGFLIHCGTVKVVFSEVVSPQSFAGDHRALSEKVRQVIIANHQKY